MPNYVVVQNGYSDDATSFGTVANTPSVHASTNLDVSSSGIFTDTWTAPNTTDSVVGVCVLPQSSIGTAGSIIAQLQGGGVDIAGVTATVTTTNLKTARWVFFKLATPYTYTTTAAGHYRWRIYHSGHSGTTRLSAASGGTLVASRSVDSRSGVPASGDSIMCLGANASTEYTLTFRGTQTIGNFASTYTTLNAGNVSGRVANFDLYVADYGTITVDKTTTGSLTIRGCVSRGLGGKVDFGTEASPILLSAPWTITIAQNSTASTYAWIQESGSTGDSTVTFVAETRTLQSTYLSGTGTLADPVVLSSAMDFAVGDKFVIGGNTYNQFEERTIASVISPTQYELSSALTYSHVSGTLVLQMTSALTVQSDSASYPLFWITNSLNANENIFKYVKFRNFGGPLTNRRGFQPELNQGEKLVMDYCMFDTIDSYALSFGASREEETFTGNVFYNLTAIANTAAISLGTLATKTFASCGFIASDRSAFVLASTYACNFTDCKMWCMGIDNNSNTGGAQIASAGGLLFQGGEIEASRTNGFVFQNAANIRIQSMSLGYKAANAIAFSATTDNYNPNILVSGCTFGAGTIFSNYQNQAPGSELVIENKNGTDFANFIYKPEGIIQFTGTGLDDTTLSPLGNRCLRFAPEDSTTGLALEFKIPVFVGGSAQLYGKFKINSAFGSDTVDVEIYLPESADPLTPDEVVTYGYTTGDWVTFQIGKEYTGTNPGLARVVIRAKSAASGAYLYVSDFFDATDETNPLASFGAAFEGKPSPVIASTIYDYSGVWNVLTSTLTTSGTTGKRLMDLATRNNILQI